MTHYDIYRSGRVFAMRYRFESAGDAIPEHAHQDWAFHNVVVLKGSCAFESQGTTRILRAGEVFDFDGRIPHRISACEPTESIHFFLNGEPADYVNVPASDLSGSIPK